jgi:hypothetical protein
MRRYRKERRLGLHWLRIPLVVTDINAFIRLGLLKEDQRTPEFLEASGGGQGLGIGGDLRSDHRGISGGCLWLKLE